MCNWPPENVPVARQIQFLSEKRPSLTSSGWFPGIYGAQHSFHTRNSIRQSLLELNLVQNEPDSMPSFQRLALTVGKAYSIES